MADPSVQPTLSPGLKRTYDGQIVPPPSHMSHLSPLQHAQPYQLQRSQSPALSTTSSSLSEISSSAVQNPMDGATGSPAKKRKLTFAEKQFKKAEEQRLKEEKARLKAEEQARREEKKRLEEEEKRRKAEEREAAKRIKEVEKAEKQVKLEEKKKAKDAEKAEKEAQKAQIEAERLKKERAQMRLGAFFGRPAPASTPPSTPEDISSGVSSRRSSIASIDMERPVLDMKPASVNPEFNSWILPFFLNENTDIAPYNRFLKANAGPGLGIQWLDDPDQAANAELQRLSWKFGPPKVRKRRVVPIDQILTKLSGTANEPIDLTGVSQTGAATQLLARTSYKILSFREDIRPPYQGTFTRDLSPKAWNKLRRNPTHRGMPKVDYDYDSEAEWEAPEAGDEDLEDEDEMSDDEDAAEDMADFLDDEEEIARRRVTTSDAEPVSTGLCWEGEVDPSVAGIDLALFRMDVLHDDTRLPIDPYSTSHWSQTGKTTPAKKKAQLSSLDESTTPAMQPPRVPLVAVSAPNASPLKKFITTTSSVNDTHEQENQAPTGQKKTAPLPKKPTKTISPDFLPAFRAAVSGSDLNKVALIEILKKQFPKCPKDAIKGTLETIAVRKGVKEVDKRWALIA